MNAPKFLILLLSAVAGAGNALAAVVPIEADLQRVVSVEDHLVGVDATGALVRSTDDGASFNVVKGPSGPDGYTALAVSGATVVAVGESGVIARSTDGGVNWNEKLPTEAINGDLLGVTAGPDGQWIAVGDSNFNAVFYRSTDNGDTWTLQESAVKGSLKAVIFEPVSARWIAVGVDLMDGFWLLSSNGNNWTRGEVPAGTAGLLDVASDSTGALMAVGEIGTVLHGGAGRTSLAKVSVGANPESLLSVASREPGAWRIGGEQQLLLRSDGTTASIIELSVAGAPDITDLLLSDEDLRVVGAFADGWIQPSKEGGREQLSVVSVTGDEIELRLGRPDSGKEYHLEYSSNLSDWTLLEDSGQADVGVDLEWTLSLPENLPVFWRVTTEF